MDSFEYVCATNFDYTADTVCGKYWWADIAMMKNRVRSTETIESFKGHVRTRVIM